MENQIPKSRRKGRSFMWARRLKHWGGALSGVLNVIFYLFIISLFLGVGGGMFGQSGGSRSEVLYGEGDDKIAVVDIAGIIMEEGEELGLVASQATTSRGLLRTFEEVKKDEDIKALVLRVNSPGGSVTASEEIFQLIKRFKEETKLPVIVSLADLAASGGYYVSLAGDVIMADSTTLTGSIGTIIQSVNFATLADKLGVKGVVIKSGENKDLLNPFEEVSEENVELLQRIVNQGREQFVARILETRPIDAFRLEEIADGRVLSGLQAKQSGLIDSLGTFNDAIDLAKSRAGIEEAKIVVYGKRGLFENFLGSVADKLDLGSYFSLPSQQLLNGQPAYLYLP